MRQETIFAKIIKGEIPCTKVYEDENHLAFFDIFPFEKGHTLVIPKKPYEKISDMPENEYADLQKVTLKLVKHFEKQLKTRVGTLIYGTDIPHVHVHIFPITKNIEIFNFEKTKKYLNGETQNLQKQLKLN